MPNALLLDWIVQSFLLSLRVTPVFLFAPPFNLTRMPRLFVWLFGLGIAMTLVEPKAHFVQAGGLNLYEIGFASILELMTGLIPVLALQLLFAAYYVVGRTIDIQSGFGLAMLIDPTTRTQKPLVGTFFALLAGVSFFAADGHLEMLRFFALSTHMLPVGGGADFQLSLLLQYIFSIFSASFGVGGICVVVLMIADIAIALIARTVPQMNALILGVQVKAVLVIVALPVAIGFSGSVLVQMNTLALKFMAEII